MKAPQVWLESTHTLSGGGRGRTGVGHYTEECISQLAAADPKRTYTVVGNVFATAQPHYPELHSQNVRFRLSRLFPGKVWNQLFKRGLMPPLNWLIPGRPDLVVFFNFVRYPLTPGIKSIVCIHDLTFRRYPDRVQGRNRRYLERFVPKALATADHFLAVSEFTKKDMVEMYGVDPERISVVPPGVDLSRFKPGLPVAEVKQKLGLPDKYFLFVSTIEPRKNIPSLLKAYRALPEAVRREYGLVLAGKIDWQVNDIVADIRQGDPVGKVLHLGYVETEDLPMVFAGAVALTFPSSFEGFGLTPLEAMATGVPVITSNLSSMPEVVEGAGIMVDPFDIPAQTKAMERVVSDEQLRAELIEKGLERAKSYTWEESGRKLKAVIEKVLAQQA